MRRGRKDSKRTGQGSMCSVRKGAALSCWRSLQKACAGSPIPYCWPRAGWLGRQWRRGVVLGFTALISPSPAPTSLVKDENPTLASAPTGNPMPGQSE